MQKDRGESVKHRMNKMDSEGEGPMQNWKAVKTGIGGKLYRPLYAREGFFFIFYISFENQQKEFKQIKFSFWDNNN